MIRPSNKVGSSSFSCFHSIKDTQSFHIGSQDHYYFPQVFLGDSWALEGSLERWEDEGFSRERHRIEYKDEGEREKNVGGKQTQPFSLLSLKRLWRRGWKDKQRRDENNREEAAQWMKCSGSLQGVFSLYLFERFLDVLYDLHSCCFLSKVSTLSFLVSC